MNFFKIVLLIGTLVGVLQSKACDPKVKSKQELSLDMALKDSAELFAAEGLPTIAEVPTQKVERKGTIKEIGEQLVVESKTLADKLVALFEEVVELTKDITPDLQNKSTKYTEINRKYWEARRKHEKAMKEWSSNVVFKECRVLNDAGEYTYPYGQEVDNKVNDQNIKISDSFISAEKILNAAKLVEDQMRKDLLKRDSRRTTRK